MSYYINNRGRYLYTIDDWCSGEMAQGYYGPFDTKPQLCAFYVGVLGYTPFYAPDASWVMEYLDILLNTGSIGTRSVTIESNNDYIMVRAGSYEILATVIHDEEITNELLDNGYNITYKN